jgi:outer membrane protein
MRLTCLWISLFILVLFSGIPETTTAQQPAKVYTLQDSIQEAFERNFTLSATEEQIIQANQVKKQALTEFLPKFRSDYVYTRLDEARIRTGPSGVVFAGRDNYEWSNLAIQPVFNGFGRLSSYELARLGVDQSETNFELGKLDLALRVKQAYFDILIADKAVDVAEKDVEFRQSNLKVARSFYEVGMVPINDVLRAEVELANSQQELVTTRNVARLTRAAFNNVLSRPIDTAAEVEDILSYQPEMGDFGDYVERALDARPEIKLINIGLLQAEQEERFAKSKFYPEVELRYNYIKAGDSPDVSGSPLVDANRWQATAVMTWTYFEWGKTHYAVKEKESLQRELAKTKLALEDNIRLEVKDALLRLENAEENIPTTEKAVEQAEENVRVNEERYKAQVTTITEVLDAQSLLTRARVNYYRALYNHHLAKASLQRALGTY